MLEADSSGYFWFLSRGQLTADGKNYDVVELNYSALQKDKNDKYLINARVPEHSN